MLRSGNPFPCVLVLLVRLLLREGYCYTVSMPSNDAEECWVAAVFVVGDEGVGEN